MSESLSERRMVENEVVFRQYNESIGQGFDEIRQLARETDQEHLIPKDDTPLYFYCECSDENCVKRLKIKPSRYTAIHKNRYHFVIVNGHEVANIERIVRKLPGYSIVEKNIEPPETVSSLQPTDIDNS